MNGNVPSREIGIAIDGTSVARQSCRNAQVMRTTSASAMMIVMMISFMEMLMNSVGSKAVMYVTPSGRSFFQFSSSAFTCLTVLRALESGLRKTARGTTSFPSNTARVE